MFVGCYISRNAFLMMVLLTSIFGAMSSAQDDSAGASGEASPLSKLMCPGTERVEGKIEPITTAFVLISIEDIQDHLALTRDQLRRVSYVFNTNLTSIPGVAELRDNIDTRLRAASTPEQKRKIKRNHMRELSKQRLTFFANGLTKVLTKKQISRLNKLQIQLHGLALVLEHHGLRDQLNLTPRKIDDISSVVQDYHAQLNESVRNYLATFLVASEHREPDETDRQGIAESIWKIWTKREEELLDLLSDQQRNAFEEARGTEVRVGISVHQPFYVPFQELEEKE